jgi:hypothetical protein
VRDFFHVSARTLAEIVDRKIGRRWPIVQAAVANMRTRQWLFCSYHDQIDRGNVKLVFEHWYLESAVNSERYFGLLALRSKHNCPARSPYLPCGES